ncbi:MAG: hypothetical protein KJP08_08995 [Gammaproteobacteria bacterium]|nr:hypothetical protein [Gammaproteobacteria bacterium]NNF48247.1 hypothetical protein [Woeseiaceae bacterium]MBT8094933.1 hypothetical protein [Gammaproteobacteria bacterium]MBT8105466.1 hypothetical protein [Gammaproteobacteria bacterium]NNK25480.1 hypothetical protein [Woeseiaceae bacterium]
MSGNRKDDEMICALTAGEHAALKTGLDALPETMPPRDVWQRIRMQGEAEGLLRQRNVLQRPSAWYAGVGVAAAVLVVAIMLPGIRQEPVGTIVPTSTGTQPGIQLTTLQTLMHESRQLETNLRELPDAPAVQRAGTMATIADLEDRIAAIDYQLNDPSIRMSDEDRELFWRERVRLMKSLLQLRYAQAQRAAF